MRSFFYSSTGFAIVFITVVLLDVFLSNSEGLVWYSLLSKLTILTLLLSYFVPQSGGFHPVERTCAIIGVVSFTMGTMLIMLSNDLNVIVSGFLLLMTGIIGYSCAFAYKVKLDIDRLLPYLVFVMLYSLVVIYFLYDLPEHIPAYIFLVMALIMLMLAYMRYERVNKESFTGAFTGAFMVLMAVTILVFDRSFGTSSWSGITVVLLFGLAQYLIVNALLMEHDETSPLLH